MPDVSLVEPGPNQSTTHSDESRRYHHSLRPFVRHDPALRGEQTVEAQQLKDSQGLTAEALQGDSPALRSNPLVKRYDGPDSGAVDRAQQRQIDLDLWPSCGHHRLERRAHLRRGDRVKRSRNAQDRSISRVVAAKCEGGAGPRGVVVRDQCDTLSFEMLWRVFI